MDPPRRLYLHSWRYDRIARTFPSQLFLLLSNQNSISLGNKIFSNYNDKRCVKLLMCANIIDLDISLLSCTIAL